MPILTPMGVGITVDISGGTFRCPPFTVDCLRESLGDTVDTGLSALIAAHSWTDGFGAPSAPPTYIAVHGYMSLQFDNYDGTCQPGLACGPEHTFHDCSVSITHDHFATPADTAGSGGTPGYPWDEESRIFGVNPIFDLQRDVSDGGHLGGDPSVFTPDELGDLLLIITGHAHRYTGTFHLIVYGWIPMENQGHIMAGPQTRGVRSRGRVVGHSESAG